MKSATLGSFVAAVGLVACSGGNAPPTPSSGGTGAFGVITVNGKQLMYYPTQTTTVFADGGVTSTVTVIDVGQKGNGMAGANAQLATVALNSMEQATTTAGDANVVLAAGTQTYNLWFIDPTTNTLTKTLVLDPSLNGSSFSGGGGIVTGIAMDEANNRAILSVWNGFLFVDLTSKTVTGGVISAAAENFGFDGVHGLIADPFYRCGLVSIVGDGGVDAGFCNAYQVPDGGGLITAGLNIVKTSSSKVYSYWLPGSLNPAAPVGSEPDSAAIDPGLQLVAVPPEDNTAEYFIDLSKAVYDDPTLTFTAPFASVQMQSIYEGVAIETKTHLALFEAEGSSSTALIDLTKLVYGDAGMPAGAVVEAQMPDTPASDAGPSSAWYNQTGSSHDPHGITVSTGLQSNGPVGFLVSDSSYGIWVARIDLTAMLALGKTSDGGVVPSTTLAPTVTLFNGSLPE